MTPHSLQAQNSCLFFFVPTLNNLSVAEDALRQDPLEAILVIFGRSSLIVFFWKFLEINEKSLLCVCAVVITLETQKMSKAGTSLGRI